MKTIVSLEVQRSYHEAAHAAVACRVGLHVEEVTLEACVFRILPPDIGAFLREAPSLRREYLHPHAVYTDVLSGLQFHGAQVYAWLQGAVSVGYAGYAAAARKLAGSRGVRALTEPSHEDVFVPTAYLEWLIPPSLRGPLYEAGRAAAPRLVDEEWERIGRIARELRRHGRLTELPE